MISARTGSSAVSPGRPAALTAVALADAGILGIFRPHFQARSGAGKQSTG